MGPKISVIVPVYKVEPYLDRCVESIVNQTYRDLEIILVDDGSPDACPAMCDAWAARDGRVLVIHQENNGPSAARNAGVKKASGSFILFIDSDDMIPKNFIDTLYRASNGDERAVAVSSVKMMGDKFGRDESGTETLDEYQTVSWDKMARLRGGWFVWGILYPTKLLLEKEIAFPEDLRNLEDMVWNSIVSMYAEHIIYLPQLPYFYRIRPGSITTKCVDRVWQCESNLLAAEKICGYAEQISSLTGEQAARLLIQRRICVNSAFFELYSAGTDMQPDIKQRIRKTQFSPWTAIKAKMKLKRKIIELTFSFCPFLENMWVYRLLFALKYRNKE